jgi:hypothetical protein
VAERSAVSPIAMKHGIAAVGSAVVVAMLAIACGGPKGAVVPSSATDVDASTPQTMASPAPSRSSDVAAPTAANAASDQSAAPADAGPSGPPEKPFAHNAEEATSFIDDAITARSNELVTCVNDARTRKKDAHAKIVVEVGIDEEGHLLGVKMPKGQKRDQPLVDCILSALRAAPFPRSHAGVITVRRTFEDRAVTR